MVTSRLQEHTTGVNRGWSPWLPGLPGTNTPDRNFTVGRRDSLGGSGSPSRFTVLQMLPALECGGVERGTLEVAAALVRRGHRSIVVSSGGRLSGMLVRQGSEHLLWPLGIKSPLTLRRIPALRRYLRQQKVDIIHVRSRMPAWIAWLAWRGMNPLTRPRLVTTVHGLYSVNRYSAIMTRGERLIAISDTAHRYIQENYPKVPEGRIRTIYRGIDPDGFPYGYQPQPAWLGAFRREFPGVVGRHVITLPGRLSRRKGHEDFVALLERLITAGLPVHGLIVGDGGGNGRHMIRMRRLIRSRGLDRHISFTGHRQDIRELFAVSCIVLSLSHEPEAFGRTVAEALHMGRPVIGYDHGGVGEILGRLFPRGCVHPGNLDALASRTREFIEQAPVVPENRFYSIANMLEATLGLYEELAAGRQGIASGARPGFPPG